MSTCVISLPADLRGTMTGSWDCRKAGTCCWNPDAQSYQSFHAQTHTRNKAWFCGGSSGTGWHTCLSKIVSGCLQTVQYARRIQVKYRWSCRSHTSSHPVCWHSGMLINMGHCIGDEWCHWTLWNAWLLDSEINKQLCCYLAAMWELISLN